MTNKVIGSDRVVIWIQEDKNEPFVPFAVGEKSAGLTGLSVPGTTFSEVYGYDRFGKPLLIKRSPEAPSGTPAGTLAIYETGQMDIIREKIDTGCPINIQSRISKCGSITNPSGWDSLDLWSGGVFESLTAGDKALGFDGTEVTTEGSLSFESYLRVVQLSLVNYVTTETENILCITGIPDVMCGDCQAGGFRGENKHLFVGTSAASGVEANVLFTNNGGGSWTVITAKPFAVDEDISQIAVTFLGTDSFRIIVGTDTTDAAAPAKWAYADVIIGDEVNATWNSVSMTGTVNGDVIEALEMISFDRAYVASAGDIYISTDGMVGDPGSAIYLGTVQLNGFTASHDGSQVWAFGDSNTLLLETDASDTFVAKVGPAGGGNFTALTVANDNQLFAGNGSSIYLSLDSAGVAGNWSMLKDFGTNKEVIKIEAVKGESQLLRVYVNDSVAGQGTVWQSVDGGATFTQYTLLANAGYNDAYFGDTNSNLGVVVGDTYNSYGLIQGLLP